MEGIKKSLYIFAYQLEPSIEIWQFKNIFFIFSKISYFLFPKIIEFATESCVQIFIIFCTKQEASSQYKVAQQCSLCSLRPCFFVGSWS